MPTISVVTRKAAGYVLACVCTAIVTSARPAVAQQTLNLSLGYFTVPGEGRVESDILLIEHHDLVFDIGDFSSAAVGGEWLVPVAERYEVGAGLSFSRRTVPTVHVRGVESDGSPIRRNLGLRQLPVALTLRVLPLGQSYRVQPYLGGGLALIYWRFSESGDFVTQTRDIFRGEHHQATGLAAGPLVLFGLRVAGERMALGVDGRYQRARGRFGPAFARVREPEIDLDGWTVGATIGMRLRR